LFIIYFDHMLEMYTEIQGRWGVTKKIQEIKVKNQRQEEEWVIRKYWNNIREEGEKVLRKPDYKENGERLAKDDKHIYADDVILKATETKKYTVN